ncbi:MAG: SMC-Scp complex subunit ScpB [Bacteroidota bacterium]
MDYLAQHIESLIFTTDQPISLKDLKATLEELFETKFQEEDLLNQIEWLMNRYKEDHFAIEIIEIGGGYQFFSKGAYHKTIGQHLKRNSKKRLSQSALETLSIIAYKQPVTKTELEQIRGVGCDYAIQKLLEKELISIAGRSEGPGRPLLYGTSGKFMDYFGLKSMKDLPKTKDFKEPEEQIGEQAPIEEPKE